MNIFSSILKSYRLLKLQRKVVNSESFDTSNFLGELKTAKRENALNEYLEFCMKDPNIIELLNIYSMSKNDLEEIYRILMAIGCGQYVKGHFVALSSLAYQEPLYYLIHARKNNISAVEIAATILEHWENKLPRGELFNKFKD